MTIAQEFADYLISKGYDPRSDRHSNLQSGIILKDLLARCPLLASRAASGQVVAKLRHKQMVAGDDWVIDIALGTCAGAPVPPEPGKSIRMAEPVIIQIALEQKGILTEHKKAARNRLRDFAAFHHHGNRYDPRTVVAAFLVVNSSDSFYSHLNLGKDTRPGKAARPELNSHTRAGKTGRQLATEIIGLFRTIHLRHSATDPQPGLDALGVVVVEHDNINYHPTPAKHASFARPTCVPPIPPNLTPGDPLSYESMCQRICAAYSQRFP